VVGEQAQAMLATDPVNAIGSPKRLLGRLHGDRELEPFLAAMAMPNTRGNYGQVMLQAQGQTYSVPQVCAPIIYRLRRLAEEHLQQEVRHAVLTAPVSFDERRLTALREAAGIAGIEAIEIVDEPTAAAVAHNFDRYFRGLIAVFDFGGGTFDFSVVDASAADMQVIATAGDIWLGGDDFDEAIASTVANAFWHDRQIELRNNVVQWQRLLLAAERAKRTLSYKQQAVVELEEAALIQEGQLNLRYPMTRIDFTRLAEPIIQRSLDTCAEALGLSEIDPGELNAIYMSGGTTYIPAVREAVAAFFGKVGRVAVPPERAVAIGAAMHGARRYVERVTIM
jgi:molecular chaperone DnaK